jgi:hypothetical protein
MTDRSRLMPLDLTHPVRGAVSLLILTMAGLWLAAARTPGDDVRAAIHADVYDRKGRSFEFADYLRAPREGLYAALAPLLLHEVMLDDEPTRVGPLVWDNEWIVSGSPVVYAGSRDVTVDGQARQQVMYVWMRQGVHGPRAQAMRGTLNEDGRPWIWEVFTDSAPGDVVFATAFAEKRATERYGEPLPGRKYSIEGVLSADRDIVVARILADGPVAAGPFVYVGKTGNVTTMHCRCSPSQIGERYRNEDGYEFAELASLVETLRSIDRSDKLSELHTWLQAPVDHLISRIRMPHDD